MSLAKASLLVLSNRLSLYNGSKSLVFVRLKSGSGGENEQYSDLTNVPPKRRSAVLSSLKKGTGGRSSFSGVVATVFGASGFLGRYMCNRLGKCGSQMIIPYRGDPYDTRHLRLTGDLGQVLFYHYNLKDEEAIRKVVKHSNVVINLIGTQFDTSNFPFDYTHVEAARNIARISREMGVSKLIQVSAMNATPEPEEYLIPGGSQWLKTKGLGELAVREEFPDAVIVRPSAMLGVEDRYINKYMNYWRRILFGKIDLYQRGEHTFVMPVHVTDVASGIVNAMFDPSSNGKTYEFVGPHCYKLGDMVDWMYDYCHRGKQFQNYMRLALGPLTTTRTNINELLTYIWKGQNLQWNWEFIERNECHSDVLTGLPTLEDLGVTDLKTFEQWAPDTLYFYMAFGYYNAKLHELPKPQPMKKYPPIRKATMETTMGRPSYERMARTAFA